MQNIPTRLTQVFWGLAIVGVDFSFRGFDVLPDFAGYVLVALGSGGLTGVSNLFNVARLLSWSLVAVSVALVLFRGSLSSLGSILSVLLDGAMMWILLGGVMEFTRGQRAALTSRTSLCRLCWLGLSIVGVVTVLLAKVFPGVAGLLGSITFVAGLILLAVTLHLIHQVKPDVTAAAKPAKPDDFKKAA